MARIFPLDFNKVDVDLGQLTIAQQEADRYTHAMSGYIRWLADRYSDLTVTLPHKMDEYRAEASNIGAHARIPASVAALRVSIELLYEFAVYIGAVDRVEAEEMTHVAWNVFKEQAKAHTERVAGENAVDQFLNTIETLLAQEKVVFLNRTSKEGPQHGVDLLGWYDTDALYLDPEASLNRVARWYRDEGRALGLTRDTLRQGLVERGMIMRSDDGRSTVRLRVNGTQSRVMALVRSQVPFAKGFGVNGPPHDKDYS